MDKSEAIDLAKKISLENGSVTVSLVQRKLRIGYISAANIVDELQAIGFCETEFSHSICGFRIVAHNQQMQATGQTTPRN